MKLGRSAMEIHPDSFQIAESPSEFGAVNPRMDSGPDEREPGFISARGTEIFDREDASPSPID